MKAWHGIIIALLIGYTLGYVWPMIGDATLAKAGIARG